LKDLQLIFDSQSASAVAAPFLVIALDSNQILASVRLAQQTPDNKDQFVLVSLHKQEEIDTINYVETL
jgi:predicted kinase